jgi:hypothetical protein
LEAAVSGNMNPGAWLASMGVQSGRVCRYLNTDVFRDPREGSKRFSNKFSKIAGG